jgi:N-acylneuraminate cytidylyltransferase
MNTVFMVLQHLAAYEPFSSTRTIYRAGVNFAEDGVDSLRAVKDASGIGKMWVVRGNRMVPLLPLGPPEQPWHSSQYQSLPVVYVQNASLEIAWSRVVFQGRTISGNVVMPFFTHDYEGSDINSEYDWKLSEDLIQSGKVVLPKITTPPYRSRS